MEIIHCDVNCLRTLEIPATCMYVYATYNKLTSITARTELPSLLELFVENNRLKEISLTDCPQLATIECDVGVTISKELLDQIDQVERLEFQKYCSMKM